MASSAMAGCLLRSLCLGKPGSRWIEQQQSSVPALQQKCPSQVISCSSQVIEAAKAEVAMAKRTITKEMARETMSMGSMMGRKVNRKRRLRTMDLLPVGRGWPTDGKRDFLACAHSQVTRINCSSSSSSAGNEGDLLTLDKAVSSVSSSSSPTSPFATSTRSPLPLSPRSAPQQRSSVRLALPSKGRMAEDTLELLRECELNVKKPNPRQYIARIPELEAVEVWFQRASDVVRKVRSGDVDFGIVGYDMLREYGEDDNDLVIVHDSLGFGHCHLAMGIPTDGRFAEIQTFDQLAAMPEWTVENPMRVVTGYTHVGSRFLQEKGIPHVQISTADGALEAAPAMGTADVILDLVSSGTTLRENNLKEIEGGTVLHSQGVLIASRKALLKSKGVLEVAHELLERIEAHLRAENQFIVTANIRGESHDDVARRLFEGTQFTGLQGPTISRVYNTPATPSSSSQQTKSEDRDPGSYFAICVIVPKKQLYKAINQLRGIGGSGVLVSPLTYIFDEEPPRWRSLLDELDLS